MAQILNTDLKPVKYPWEEWADGQARLLVKGEDFTCETISMISSLRKYADKVGKSVVVLRHKENRDNLEVQFSQ
jgi:hypothetical protein